MSSETQLLPPSTDLLDPSVPETACLPALEALGFGDPAGALRNVRRLAETPRQAELLAAILPRLLRQLGASADPDMALNNLERLAVAVMDRGLLYTQLRDHPQAMAVVVTLAAGSQFLADTLVRTPQLLPWLLDPRVMRPRPREGMHEEIAAAVRPFRTEEARANALRRVKRREFCRIGLRDMLGDADLVTTTQELSNLADACLQQAWEIVRPGLIERYGVPRHHPTGGGVPTTDSPGRLGPVALGASGPSGGPPLDPPHLGVARRTLSLSPPRSRSSRWASSVEKSSTTPPTSTSASSTRRRGRPTAPRARRTGSSSRGSPSGCWRC